MSLVGTLGRIAVGVMVAKGASKMLGGGSRGGGGGLGGLLGSVLGGGAAGGGSRPGAGGGLGDMGALLGGSSGGGQRSGGGLGGLLESIAGGGAPNAGAAPSGGSFGDMLNSALQGNKPAAPSQSHEDQARLLIRAMITAAKSDGQIDQTEQQKIVEHLGDDMTEEERQFVISEIQSPFDPDGFIRDVPSQAAQQVYMMSLMGIDLDSQAEAKYLDSLRSKLGLSKDISNAIHAQLGAPTLYG